MTLFVLSGPSGVGKDTVANRVLDIVPGLKINTSITTRSPRPDDKSGRYMYVTPQVFHDHVRNGDVLEWAEYSGNLYGSLRPKKGHSLLVIEIQGAKQVLELDNSAQLIFLAPPGITVQDQLATLESRQRSRGDDDPAEIRRRLETARFELQAASWFHHFFTNDDLNLTVQRVSKLIANLMRPRTRSLV